MAGVAVTLYDPKITRFAGEIDPSRMDLVRRRGTLAFDSSYPNTGGTVGELLAANKFELDTIVLALFRPFAGYLFSWDPTAGVIHAWYGNNDAVDGPMVEVPNGTDLSSLTAVAFKVYGTVTLTHEI